MQQKDGSTVGGPLAAHMHGGSMHGRDICRYQVPYHGDTHWCTDHMLSSASRSRVWEELRGGARGREGIGG